MATLRRSQRAKTAALKAVDQSENEVSDKPVDLIPSLVNTITVLNQFCQQICAVKLNTTYIC